MLAICPCATALRGFTPADRKVAEELWTKSATSQTTAYGQPLFESLTKTTSVDHFGSVRRSVLVDTSSLAQDSCRRTVHGSNLPGSTDRLPPNPGSVY